MILRRAERLALLHWQGKLMPYTERETLTLAHGIMCGELSPDDQTENYHVAIVPSRCNMIAYGSKFEQMMTLKTSLKKAAIAEELNISRQL